MARDQQMLVAVRAYYEQNRTMDSIAAELGASRSTVSRLLSLARDSGVVHVRITPPRGRTTAVEERLRARYGIDAEVVAVEEGLSGEERYVRTAVRGAQRLTELMTADIVVAVSWGTMVNALSHHLEGKPVAGAVFVQANGLGQSSTTGVHYSFGMMDRFGRAFDANVQLFPFPIFLDADVSRDTLRRERLMQHVETLIERADVMLFNLGTVNEGVPSNPYLNGYFLDDDDFAMLRADGAVGDLATTFIDADGEWARIRFNRRTTGPDLARVRSIPHRLCVVSGRHKTPALRAALAAGLITELVIDEWTAETLLQEE